MTLEPRKCAACGSTFKVLPTSKQVYCRKSCNPEPYTARDWAEAKDAFMKKKKNQGE